MDYKTQEMRSLINELNRLTVLYDMGTPEVPDSEWDTMYFTLKNMEESEGVVYPDSPTQTIHFEKLSSLEKVKHNHLMLSLDKTKDINKLEDFVKGQDWFGMFKMDGLSCSLTYKNGILVGAETRGNGEIGEDILHNALVIKSIPKKIPNKELTIVDGEIICDWETFNKYFAKDYKNPRNFASGSIRQLNSEETYMRKLTFVAWDLIEGIDEDFQFWRLEKLDDWGFTTVPRVGDAETIDDAIKIMDEMREEDSIYSKYPIDGYVFKFESKSYGDSLGRTEHHFNSAIAYKFYDEEYETRLNRISYDVSRNGVLTPVAVFDPIEIDGTMVSKASLHNISIMKEILGDTPYHGQIIWVIKSNQIIPQITRAIKKNYGEIVAAGGATVGLGGDFGVICPICGGFTKIITSESGVETLVCGNPECEGKLAQRLNYFCGKKGLDIKGISRATIEKLIDWEYVKEIKDIFNLNKYKKEWVNKDGFGEKSVSKILDNIEQGRNTRLDQFISAIGIPLVGIKVAKDITKYFDTWEDFRNAVGGDWTEFEGFGPEINSAINKFNYTEADEIAKLLNFIEIEETKEDSKIAEMTFCVTGKLHNFKNRDALKADIESKGGKVVGSISSKVNYLINNDANSTSSKNKAAKAAGIPIITEDEYLHMVEKL